MSSLCRLHSNHYWFKCSCIWKLLYWHSFGFSGVTTMKVKIGDTANAMQISMPVRTTQRKKSEISSLLDWLTFRLETKKKCYVESCDFGQVACMNLAFSFLLLNLRTTKQKKTCCSRLTSRGMLAHYILRVNCKLSSSIGKSLIRFWQMSIDWCKLIVLLVVF